MIREANINDFERLMKLERDSFNEDEVVMQLHPAKKEYVNIKNNCLHLWRPIGVEIPTPPRFMV